MLQTDTCRKLNSEREKKTLVICFQICTNMKRTELVMRENFENVDITGKMIYNPFACFDYVC